MICKQCGACCREMNSPPFLGMDDPYFAGLPPAIRASYERGMAGREFTGWPDGVPCFWLTEEGRCRYYQYRPEVCRDFEPGGESCLAWRQAAEAAKEE